MRGRLLLTLLTLGALALVSAAPSKIQKHSFTLNRIPNPEFTGRNGPRALANAYRKYGAALPPGLEKELEAQLEAKVKDGTLVRRRRRTRDLDLSEVEFSDDESMSIETWTIPYFEHGPATNNYTALSWFYITPDWVYLTPVRVDDKIERLPAIPVYNDIQYIIPLKVGGQSVHVALDTGSTDFWVFGPRLGEGVKTGHDIFDPAASKTFKWIEGANFSAKYADESTASGLVGTDRVEVGSVTVTGQAVGLATQVSRLFAENMHTDGMLGMAAGNDASRFRPDKQTTLFQNLMPHLAQPLFTAALRRHEDGAYEFGRINHRLHEGHLAWVPCISEQGLWMFESKTWAVAGGVERELPRKNGRAARAIIDTGTTLILAQADMVEHYYHSVVGAEEFSSGFYIPCDTTPPDLDLDIGGKYTARVKGKYLRWSKEPNNKCFGGLQRRPKQMNYNLYGDIFLKSQFVVFHGGNFSLGLAPLIEK